MCSACSLSRVLSYFLEKKWDQNFEIGYTEATGMLEASFQIKEAQFRYISEI